MAEVFGEDKESREERIKNLISSIKSSRKKKFRMETGSARKITQARGRGERQKYRITVGWQNYRIGKYRVVTKGKGCGNRIIEYQFGEEITVDYIQKVSSGFFFPEGKNNIGNLDEFDVSIASSNGQTLETFVDTNKNPCSFTQFLKSNGIFASQCHLYLRTKIKEKQVRNFFIVNGINATNTVSIKYSKIVTHEYGNDTSEVSCYSYNSCCNFSRIPEDDYDPFENDFLVTKISLDNKIYLEQIEDGHACPQAAKEQKMFHGPSEIYGFETDEKNILVLCLITVAHNNNWLHSWYKNGILFCSGINRCILRVTEPGEYSVSVSSTGEDSAANTVICSDTVMVDVYSEQVETGSFSTLHHPIQSYAIETAVPSSTISSAVPSDTVSSAIPFNTVSSAKLSITINSDVLSNTVSSAILSNTIGSAVPSDTISSAVPFNTVSSAILSNTIRSAVPSNTVSSDIPFNTVSSAILSNTIGSAVPSDTISSEIPFNTVSSAILSNTISSAIPFNTVSSAILSNTSSSAVTSNTTSSAVTSCTISSAILSNTTFISAVESNTVSSPILSDTMNSVLPCSSVSSSIPSCNIGSEAQFQTLSLGAECYTANPVTQYQNLKSSTQCPSVCNTADILCTPPKFQRISSGKQSDVVRLPVQSNTKHAQALSQSQTLIGISLPKGTSQKQTGTLDINCPLESTSCVPTVNLTDLHLGKEIGRGHSVLFLKEIG